ncbi:hypothetical protein Tco_1019314 [Tanacetum coccineum]|uniref:Uncharacterized protein n=1 Tax=Tanacetum coccineum TaxID=301880 RepID=A0ABQ5FYH4_9ASTR
MSTQQDINVIRAQQLENTHDPLALMANTQTPFHPDQSSHITYVQLPQPNNNFFQQPSFNTNYMPQPMQNPKDSINTSQDIKLQMVDDNVGNQQLQIAQEEEAGIQSTQEECEFMAADAYEETERVKYTDLQTKLDHTKEKLENCIIKKEKEYAVLWNNWYTKCEECKYDKILYDKAYNDMQQQIERLQDQLGDLRIGYPYKSKSSCLSNNVEKIEENHRNSQIPKNQKYMSSECNNITLSILNAKSEIICVMCKQCLVTANHDVCVLNYVNDMNSRADNQSANVSKRENQKKHKVNVRKSKELGSKGSLASSRPSKPRTCLRWIPTGRIFAMCGKLTASSNTENKSDKSVCDNASTSNPSEPSSKGFLISTSLLGRLSRLRKQHTSIYPIVVL